ncbi:MAG: fluoride efflux transporter CrcB [Solirubrobacterales bacterium]
MNSPAVVIGVALLGGLGAVARYAIHSAVVRANAADFPLGTFIVNALGSFAGGLLLGAAAGHDAHWLIAVGFLGAFTTFSTWMFESERLAADGYARTAVVNIVFSSAVGLGAVALGVVAGHAL